MQTPQRGSEADAIESENYAKIQTLRQWKNEASKGDRSHWAKSTRMGAATQAGMPYVLKPHPKGGYTIEGRFGRPLMGVIPELTARQVARISHTGRVADDGCIYLYDDACSPGIGQRQRNAAFTRRVVHLGFMVIPTIWW